MPKLTSGRGGRTSSVLLGPRRGRGSSSASTNGGSTRGPRKKMALDVLMEYDANHLLKGYSPDQLTDLHNKVWDLANDLCHALDYGGDVQEIVGAKMDNKNMYFYVRWEDATCSFVPASVLNRTAPEKVIQYYESILNFQPVSEADQERGLEKLLNNSSQNVLMDQNVKKAMKEQEAIQRRIETRSEPQQDLPTPPAPQPSAPPKYRTMNCTGCAILLQYPEGTKAIKCPVCNTVMHAR